MAAPIEVLTGPGPLDEDAETDNRPPAPIDKVTGIPLILAPRDLSRYALSDINFHHPWGKLWSDHAVDIPEGERILRRSYGQRTLKVFHNGESDTAFHTLTKRVSVPIPEDEMDMAGAITLPQLGYKAKHVVDTRKGKLTERSITDSEERIINRRRPIASAVTREEIDKFQAKWCPEASREKAAQILWAYRVQQRRYSYRDIDSGSDYNHVRSYITGLFVGRELEDDVSGRFRSLLERDDQSSDEALLEIVAASVAANVTIKGKRLAAMYPWLIKNDRLYPGMSHSLVDFLTFRLANPLGGIALSPSRRNQLLGREEAGTVDEQG